MVKTPRRIWDRPRLRRDSWLLGISIVWVVALLGGLMFLFSEALKETPHSLDTDIHWRAITFRASLLLRLARAISTARPSSRPDVRRGIAGLMPGFSFPT